MAELYKSIADEIWENPELSFKEYKAAGLYCKVLRDNGFAVTEKLCGVDTAFCGSFGCCKKQRRSLKNGRQAAMSARLRRVQSR